MNKLYNPKVLISVSVLFIFFTIYFVFFYDTKKTNVNIVDNIDIINNNITNIPNSDVSLEISNLPIPIQTTINKDANNKISSNKTGVTILIPSNMFDKGFIDLSQESNINIKYRNITKLSNYKRLLELDMSKYKDVDLFLVPIDRLDQIQTNIGYVDIGERGGIKPYFHKSFHPYVDLNQYTFIPFSIDPIVVYMSKDANYKYLDYNIGSIFAYLTLYTSTKKNTIPVLWSMDNNDIKLISNNTEIFPNYSFLVEQIIDNYIFNNDVDGLKNFFDISKYKSIFSFDTEKFKQIYETIGKRDSNCVLYPDICFLAYGFANIKLGFVSDQIIWDKNFGKTINNNSNIKMGSLFDNYSEQKIRGRGFVINKYSDNNELIKSFIKNYIRGGITNNISLRNNNISAFNNIFNLQKSQKKYNNILKNEQNFIFIQGYVNTKEFVSKTELQKMIEGEINVTKYIENYKKLYQID